ncbi:MAG: hypothetical protein PHD35_13045, partial [Synergistaceae bacterium]|nr:hypothetical protein [Synergistaceae bacterium]
MRKAPRISRFPVPALLALLFILVPLSFPVHSAEAPAAHQAGDPAAQAAGPAPQLAPRAPVAPGTFGEPVPSEER